MATAWVDKLKAAQKTCLIQDGKLYNVRVFVIVYRRVGLKRLTGGLSQQGSVKNNWRIIKNI